MRNLTLLSHHLNFRGDEEEEATLQAHLHVTNSDRTSAEPGRSQFFRRRKLKYIITFLDSAHPKVIRVVFK